MSCNYVSLLVLSIQLFIFPSRIITTYKYLETFILCTIVIFIVKDN